MPRRKVVAEVLEECPVGGWITVEEVFRLVRASGQSIAIARNPWRLYIAKRQYGSLG